MRRCEIQRLLPSGITLELSSCGKRWCLKSACGDVLLLNWDGMPHDMVHESLEDVLSSLYKCELFIVHETSSDGKIRRTGARLIRNPFFKCRSLEEVAVKNELEAMKS